MIEGRYGEADAFLVPHEERARQRTDARQGPASATPGAGCSGHKGTWPAARVGVRAARARRDLPLRYDRARVGYAYGETLRRAGKRREADDGPHGRESTGLGATTYVERCDRELRAGGVRAARAAPADRDAEALTPQEEAVATLVARGLSQP